MPEKRRPKYTEGAILDPHLWPFVTETSKPVLQSYLAESFAPVCHGLKHLFGAGIGQKIVKNRACQPTRARLSSALFWGNPMGQAACPWRLHPVK